jgi:hypothetical protein
LKTRRGLSYRVARRPTPEVDVRQLITVVIIGSILVMLLVLFGNGATGDDDIARSVTQWVEKSR